jgi:two-component system, OmpR family, sensor kinase
VVFVLSGPSGVARPAQLIAGAIGPPAAFLLLPPVTGERGPVWQLLGNVAMFGVAALLAAAAGWSPRGRVSGRVWMLVALGTVMVAMAAVAVTGAARPSWAPPIGVLIVTGGLSWSAVATAAALLIAAGVLERRRLLRRVGLAVGLALLSVVGGGSTALELAAAVLLLVAAAEQVGPALRRRPPVSTAADPVVRRPAPPARILPAPARSDASRPEPAPLDPANPHTTDLRAADLDRTPSGIVPDLDSSSDGPIAVAPVIDDLALLYRAVGLDVRVEVHGEPWVGVGSGGLARLLANLLANCARHAPGSEVRLRAVTRGPRVRIEVIDNGPGLPPGSTARLLRRGERGPGSTGAGMGLAICTELVDRYRGTFTVVSTSAGCTAVVELPTVRRGAAAQVMSV